MNAVDRMYEEMLIQNIIPAEMARRLNITPSRISNWKPRGSIPKECELPICFELNIRIEWLKKGELPKRSNDKHPRVESNESFSPDELALVQKYRQMTEDKKKAMQTMGDALNQPEIVRKVG